MVCPHFTLDATCATVSPYIKKQVEARVAAGEFSSMSDLVNIALTEFLAKQESVKAEGRKVVIE
jgi:Arc/MetJ-type ribon-helix-helix transcriptional regulator